MFYQEKLDSDQFGFVGRHDLFLLQFYKVDGFKERLVPYLTLETV